MTFAVGKQMCFYKLSMNRHSVMMRSFHCDNFSLAGLGAAASLVKDTW